VETDGGARVESAVQPIRLSVLVYVSGAEFVCAVRILEVCVDPGA